MGHGPGRGAGWVVSADTWPEWRPGMADINGTRVESILRAEDEWLFTTIGDRYGEDLDPPDTDDPATVGCIHAQAEEASREQRLAAGRATSCAPSRRGRRWPRRSGSACASWPRSPASVSTRSAGCRLGVTGPGWMVARWTAGRLARG